MILLSRIHMDVKLEQKLSVAVSRALDSLGYSYSCIKTRQRMWKEVERNLNDDPDATFIMAGSKAEGVSLWLESDIDQMVSVNNILSTDNVGNIDRDRYKAVLEMKTDNVAEGYTRLKHTDFHSVKRMARTDENFREILDWSFQDEDGAYYFSSEFVHEGNEGTRSGPAMTMIESFGQNDQSNSKLLTSFDAVLAIPCKTDTLLQSWVNRPRRHDWPSQEVIRQISISECHVVPVGNKESKTQYKEWRICCTPAELLLVKSFNGTHSQLYILMKKVAKRLLRPLCAGITSYIIKNIIFWIAESCPTEIWKAENLLTLLMCTVKFLHSRVSDGQLRNYMIPGRNLFAGKLPQDQQQSVCHMLSTLITQGPAFIVQRPEFDRLRRRTLLVYRNPEFGLYEQVSREMFEVLFAQLIDDDYPWESIIPPTFMMDLLHLLASLHVHPDVIKGLICAFDYYMHHPCA